DKETPDFEKEILTIAQRLRSEPAAPLVAVADGLLARARQHYSSGGDWCNLLHDVRDVLSASSADKNAAADYIKWRIENKARFGLVPKSKETADETEKPKEAAFTTDLEVRVRETSGALKAHWLYLVGATNYKAGDRKDCLPWFERVVKEFPAHPRAEIALFMQARSAFSESRRGIESQDERTPEQAKARGPARKKAAEVFERYRKQYPHGSFEADALRWLGGLALGGDSFLKALENYIVAAEPSGHT